MACRPESCPIRKIDLPGHGQIDLPHQPEQTNKPPTPPEERGERSNASTFATAGLRLDRGRRYRLASGQSCETLFSIRTGQSMM